MSGTNLLDHQATWETYVAAWKAEGAERKRGILSRCLADAGVYTDPLASTTGVDDLTDYMVDFHRQVPGGHFVTTYFLAYDRRSIARWNMVDGAGVVIGEGISYGEYDPAGRLRAMTGFFETAAGAGPAEAVSGTPA
jgi:hypothetical protein